MVGGEFRELSEETRRWLDLATTQIAALRAQINDYERLRAAARGVEEENRRLSRLADEHGKLGAQLETSERLCQQLREEVDRLRAETRQNREREEVADSLTTMLSELLLQLRPQLALAPTGEPGPLTSRFEQALLYAKRAHGRRTWQGTQIPYVARPLSVAALVLEDGGDEDEAIAALLHDAVGADDGVTTFEDVHRRFGDRVARIVEGCRDPAASPTLPWHEQRARLLDHLRRARPDVLRLSAAEALHDARMALADCRATGEPPWSRFGVGRDEIRWYYRSLVEVCRSRGRAALAEDLGRVAADVDAGPTRAGRSALPTAGRSMFGVLRMATIGGIFLGVAILVWTFFSSAVDMWWSFVRPLLNP